MTDVHAVVAPDDIDVGFVPQLSQNLVAMEVGAETVLLGDYGQALVLNPTAGLVWRFLDGETALADLIDDFSEVLDVDRDTVRTDIVDFVRTLGRNGLLQGVAEPIDDQRPRRDRLVTTGAGRRRRGARATGLSPTWTAPPPPWRRRQTGGSCSSTGAPGVGSASPPPPRWPPPRTGWPRRASISSS